MFEVGIAAERAVQVGHAGREVLGEVVDVAGGDLGADGGSRVGAVGAVGGDEVLGEVVEDRGEAVVLVETGERAGRELLALVLVSLLMSAMHTSSCLSSLETNSPTTMLACSLPGTNALPFFKNTLRCSTSSGTRSQSTLNQSSSSMALAPRVRDMDFSS